MEYSVRKTKEHDCYVLSKVMREADKQEIWSSGRFTPLTGLLEGYNVSTDHCYTLLLEDEIVGIFGVSKVNEDIGVVWLMGSDNLINFHKCKY